MTRMDRIVQNVLHDPWTSRIFLAFTVGLFLSCSAEFAASQDVVLRSESPSRASAVAPLDVVSSITGTVR